MLQAAAVERRGRRAGGVVVERQVLEGVVEAGDAVAAGDGEVRPGRHVRIDVAGQGGRRRTCGGAAEEVDEPPVMRAGLEHVDAAAAAMGLHVQHEADLAARALGAEQHARTQQPGLLAVGQQEHDVARRRPRGLERPHRLECGGDARAVVGRSRRGKDRVVMGHQSEGRQRAVAAGEGADDVLHLSAVDEGQGRIGAPGDRLAVHDGDLEAELTAATDEIVAHPVMLGRAQGVGLGTDREDVGVGALGRERRRGGGCRLRRRRARRRPRDRACDHEASDQGGGSQHAAPPWRMITRLGPCRRTRRP